MSKYPRTALPSVVSVRSIITVWHFHLKNQTSANDIHNHPEILYVDKGQHTLKIDGNLLVLDAGQMVIYGPNSLHCGPVQSNATIDIVSFEAESPLLTPYYNKVITLSPRQRAMLSQIITDGTDLFDRLRHKYGFIDLPRDTEIQDIELQMLKNRLELFLIDICMNPEYSQASVIASNAENAKHAQFQKLADYMKANLAGQISLDALSQHLSISPSSVIKLCHDCCGQTPITYFIQLKIAEAKRLICESSFNFSQIAESLGYNSVHYFSSQFKKETGQTPSEYAASIQKK